MIDPIFPGFSATLAARQHRFVYEGEGTPLPLEERIGFMARRSGAVFIEGFGAQVFLWRREFEQGAACLGGIGSSRLP